jgi:pyrimidine operon attenuation protein/uracil phosphoribosyltransferase
LAVLIDRGGRELPIQPDIVGKKVSAPSSQRVDVMVEELDGKNAVVITEREEDGA